MARRVHVIDLIAAGLLIFFLVTGVATLSDYGFTWDEALGNGFFGQRNLYYLRTLDVKYLDYKSDLKVLEGQPLDLSASPFRDQQPTVYPPVADTLAALTMQVFSYEFHWMNPVAAFHLSAVLLTSILLMGVYWWVSRHFDKYAALFSVFMIGFAPRFWGDMHVNIKDVPEAVFFSLTILCYAWWFEKRKWYLAVLSGVFFGLALGTKPNIVFAPIILILGLWSFPRVDQLKSLKSEVWPFLRAHLIMGASAVHVFWLSWPYLWGDPRRVMDYFTYFASQDSRIVEQVWHWQPFGIALAVLTISMLIALPIGLYFLIQKPGFRLHPHARLLVAWLLVPIIRISWPGMANFDGIRHYLEFLPAAGIIAGIGVGQLVELFIGKGIRGRLLSGLLIGGMLIETAVIYLEFHPFEFIYFNPLFGGLPGAAETFGENEATDYMCSSYQSGMQWLSENAPPQTQLYVPICGHVTAVSRGLWLRDDISLLSEDQFVSTSQEDYTRFVMFITRPGWYDEHTDRIFQDGELVYSRVVQGVPVLVIYRMP